MSQETWSAVDNYFNGLLLAPDSVLENALQAQVDGGLPAINVAPNQGKMLQLLAKIHGAKTILEIGTLGGYSTIWLARALPEGGKLTTLEYDPKHAKVATANIASAGLSDKVEVIVGKAVDTLPTLTGPFDLIFIDADKPSNPDYFQWAMKLSRPGTLIIIDNVVRNGGVADPNSSDENVIGVQRVTELVAAEPRVSATTIQSVGSKGYDGLMLIVVTGDS